MMEQHHGGPGVFVAVFVALIVLTTVTVGVAMVDLGRLNVIAALGIAAIKGLLVLVFFMEMRASSRLTWIVATGGFFWLSVMIVLTMSDVVSRGWLGNAGGLVP